MARILVIDDDNLFVKLMVHALAQRGHEVEFALDGRKGCRTFASSPFDAVVCDMLMPEQEGVQTITQLRTASPDVAIIAISGGLSMGGPNGFDVLRIADKFGADATLEKPFDLPKLVAVVEQAINARSEVQSAQTA
jgi:CheY-like chemotaxis protein